MDSQTTGAIFAILGGVWGVARLLIGSYWKQREKLLQLEKSQVERAISSLKLITQDHSKEIKSLSNQMIAVDKTLIKLTERLARVDQNVQTFETKEQELVALLNRILHFINGDPHKSEVIQVGSAFLVRKKKD